MRCHRHIVHVHPYMNVLSLMAPQTCSSTDVNHACAILLMCFGTVSIWNVKHVDIGQLSFYDFFISFI